MPGFSYNPPSRLPVLHSDLIKISKKELGFRQLIHLYFIDEFKVEFFLDWLKCVAHDTINDKAILINDCSFSHAFTKELIRLIGIGIPQCKFVYLIRERLRGASVIGKRNEETPLSISEAKISLEMLDILIHEDISALERKPEVEGNCIIAIPYSSYLRKELNPNTTFVVLNVSPKYANIINEIKLMKVFKKMKEETLLKELDDFKR